MRWLRNWSPRKLFAAWIGYWIALLAALVGPAIPAIWRGTHAASGQGNISFGFGNGVFTLSVTVSGTEIWSGSISAIALVLWIGVPPLLLWLAWLSQRSSPAERQAGVR
jgi:hypothetical protein